MQRFCPLPERVGWHHQISPELFCSYPPPKMAIGIQDSRPWVFSMVLPRMLMLFSPFLRRRCHRARFRWWCRSPMVFFNDLMPWGVYNAHGLMAHRCSGFWSHIRCLEEDVFNTNFTWTWTWIVGVFRNRLPLSDIFWCILISSDNKHQVRTLVEGFGFVFLGSSWSGEGIGHEVWFNFEPTCSTVVPVGCFWRGWFSLLSMSFTEPAQWHVAVCPAGWRFGIRWWTSRTPGKWGCPKMGGGRDVLIGH